MFYYHLVEFTPRIIANLFMILCLGIQVYFTVRSIITWRKSGKSYIKDMEKFTESLLKSTEAWKNEHIERLNLLSKENNKLREKNEIYRDKLKNMGFSDITLDT